MILILIMKKTFNMVKYGNIYFMQLIIIYILVYSVVIGLDMCKSNTINLWTKLSGLEPDCLNQLLYMKKTCLIFVIYIYINLLTRLIKINCLM